MKKTIYLLFIFVLLLFLGSCSKKSKAPAIPRNIPANVKSAIPSTSTPSVPTSTPTKPSVPSPSTSAPATPKAPPLSNRPDPSTLNKSRPSAKTFDGSSEYSPILSLDDEKADNDKKSDYDDYYDEEDDVDTRIFNEIIEDVPEKEADVPIFNDNDIFFYQTVSNDRPNEKFRIIDAQMNYNVDPDRLYTLEEVLNLYDDNASMEQAQEKKTVSIPTFEELKKELAERSKDDQNFIKAEVVNTYRTDYERQRRREALLANNDFYEITITNEATSTDGTRRSLGMMTLDTFISSVNRVQLKTEEEAILSGASVYNAVPIDLSLSFSPYSFAFLKDLELGEFEVPRYAMSASGRVHYKIQNELNFMISAGLKFGLNQSVKPIVYNLPLFAEVGLGLKKFDIYAGAGLMFSDPAHGFFAIGAEIEGFYNYFFEKHSSVFFGANISFGVAMGNLKSGKKVEFSKFFISPLVGYKFALDSVRNDKVISYDDIEWYEIIILDPVKEVKHDKNAALDRHTRFFVETHYTGDPFDINFYGSPYVFSAFIQREPVVDIQISKYALNFATSGHYKLISTPDMSVGLGVRFDFTQSFGKMYSIIPLLVDANLSLLDVGVDLHAGLGMSITHAVHGGVVFGAKVGASYNLPLSLQSFLMIGLDLSIRFKIDLQSEYKVAVSHIQVDPFIGYKYSFDKYERLVFDAVTGLSTEECYIIDIINSVEEKDEAILKE